MLILSSYVFQGCQQLLQLKDVGEMSPKQKAEYFLEVYDLQKEIYDSQMARTDLTERQKKYLETKGTVLAKLNSLALAYSSYVKSGTIPTAELELEIVELIYKLYSK